MMSSRFLPCLALLAGWSLGCESIAGLERYTGEPVDSLGDGVTDTRPEGCALPTEGDAKLRFAHLDPSDDRVDFCVKSTSESWTGRTPIIYSSGQDCPVGLGYKDVTQAMGITQGLYDVRVVEADASCEDTAALLVEDQIELTAGNFGLSVLRLDGAAALVLREEARVRNSTNIALTALNATVSYGAVDVGVVVEDAYAPVLFEGVRVGELPTRGGPLGTPRDGYVELTNLQTYRTAASRTGEPPDVEVSFDLENTQVVTLYVVGENGSTRFPLQIMQCLDTEVRAGSILSSCGAVSLSTTVFTARLIGPFEPYMEARTAAILEQLPSFDTDFQCITELWDDELKAELASRAEGTFPYSSWVVTDLDSLPTIDTDLSGATPERPTTPACQGYEDQAQAVLDCIEANCTEADGSLTSGDLQECLAGSCSLQIIPFLTSTVTEQLQCWSAIFVNLASDVVPDEVYTKVTTDPRARLAWDGHNSTMVLSRFPLGETEHLLFPSAEWPNVILRTPVTLPSGTVVDVYCTQLTKPPEGGGTRPYSGLYGANADGAQPEDDESKWQNEQLNQVGQVVDWIRERSGGRRAILLGEFWAGPEIPPNLREWNPQAHTRLETSLPLALPFGYVPLCTLCDSNVINGAQDSEDGLWSSAARYFNLASTDAASAAVVFTEATIDVGLTDDAGEPVLIPLSAHYGFELTTLIR